VAAHGVLQGTKGAASYRLQAPPRPGLPRAGAMLLSSDAEDEEAMAVAGILSLELQEWAMNKTSQSLTIMGDIQEIASQTMPFSSLRKMVARSRATILVLTSGSLTSHQLTTILVATEAMCEHSGHEVVSLNTPEFRFPTEAFYENTLAKVLKPSDGIDVEEAARLLQLQFKLISVAFSPASSLAIIKAQAVQVPKRILLDKNKFEQLSSSLGNDMRGGRSNKASGTQSARIGKVNSHRQQGKRDPPQEEVKPEDGTLRALREEHLGKDDKDPGDEDDVVFAAEV